jgi:pimeloyl-ACP methyl ester carboxylesterase
MERSLEQLSGFTPSADQLLAASFWSPANNHLGLKTAWDWQSDLAGFSFNHSRQMLRQLEVWRCAFSKGSPLSIGLTLTEHAYQQGFFNPLRDQLQQRVNQGLDPDPYQQHNIQIESRYAELIKQLCALCFEADSFSRAKAEQLFQQPLRAAHFYRLLTELQTLEYSYHSLGLTRLTALKELLTSLLMLITNTPASGPHPYRRYDEQGQPTDSFEAYLSQCQMRLEKLYQQDAFDLVRFSEQSAAARIGCSDYQSVDGSNWHGVSLRYYPCPADQDKRRPVIYLSSPLINRPEIFDLAPGKSVIEALLNAGHSVYLVDYSRAGEHPGHLGLDFYGKQVHDRYLELVKQRHPEQQIHAMGYCMGGCLMLTYLARRAQEREIQGLAMDITKLVLMATPVYFDDDNSGHRTMRDMIRQHYDPQLLSSLFDGVNIPPQLIEAGMHHIQPGVRYTVTRGFYERATFEGAIEDAAPFLNWLNHGTRFPARAHREWIQQVFIDNQIWRNRYKLSSPLAELDGKPVDMEALTRAGVQLMDYRGLRDPISPTGSCIASECWGAQGSDHHNETINSDGLNRTIEKNIGHIFVVSRKLLGEFMELALEFYQDR